MEKFPFKQVKTRGKGEAESVSRSEILQDLGPYMGLGWVLAVSVLGGTLGGVYLDRTFDTKPWLTLTGIFLGMTAGFVSLFRTLKAQSEHRRKPDADEGSKPDVTD